MFMGRASMPHALQASRAPDAGARARLDASWCRSCVLPLLAASFLQMSGGTVISTEPRYDLRGMHLEITARVPLLPALGPAAAWRFRYLIVWQKK